MQTCFYCRKDFPDEAKACPYCGAGIPVSVPFFKSPVGWFAMFAIIAVSIECGVLLWNFTEIQKWMALLSIPMLVIVFVFLLMISGQVMNFFVLMAIIAILAPMLLIAHANVKKKARSTNIPAGSGKRIVEESK